MEFLVVFLTLQMLLYSAIEDLQTYHIPNYLTFSTMGFGVLMMFLYPKSITNVILIFIGITVLFIMAYYHVMGMGDIKLYMAILLLNGLYLTLFCLYGSIMTIEVMTQWGALPLFLFSY